jgi:hypothetical protein
MKYMSYHFDTKMLLHLNVIRSYLVWHKKHKDETFAIFHTLEWETSSHLLLLEAHKCVTICFFSKIELKQNLKEIHNFYMCEC